MKKIVIKSNNYSILIGSNLLPSLSKEIQKLSPKCKKVAIIVDNKVPKKFIKKIKTILKKYEVFVFSTKSSEKIKSLNKANYFMNKLFNLKLNRSDLIIGMGGGIIGDLSGFVSSIFKRGINFINIPTTLLAQVDSCIGGKTGVNSNYGKNMIGSFYQPKLVLSDVTFLNSLPKREMTCGYAEILKHAIIKDKKFFKWLKLNTKNILEKKSKFLINAIKYSCKIKLKFTERDFKEKNIRMILNFGHTFAHALEASNKFNSKLNHGEAVLIGMRIASKFSLYKKICSNKTDEEISQIYASNNLLKNLNKYFSRNKILNSIKYMRNDKKNNDEKINLILLKSVGLTSLPGKYKFYPSQIKKIITELF